MYGDWEKVKKRGDEWRIMWNVECGEKGEGGGVWPFNGKLAEEAAEAASVIAWKTEGEHLLAVQAHEHVLRLGLALIAHPIWRRCHAGRRRSRSRCCCRRLRLGTGASLPAATRLLRTTSTPTAQQTRHPTATGCYAFRDVRVVASRHASPMRVGRAARLIRAAATSLLRYWLARRRLANRLIDLLLRAGTLSRRTPSTCRLYCTQISNLLAPLHRVSYRTHFDIQVKTCLKSMQLAATSRLSVLLAREKGVHKFSKPNWCESKRRFS